MRVFYVYNINEFYSDMYSQYPYRLYKMLEDAYYTSKHDMLLSTSLYEQVIVKFNKLFMNNYLFCNHKLDSYYYNKNNMHVISNLEECSKLMISSYSLKLKTNLSYPSFFTTLRNFNENIFICDFENQDYFWLNKVKRVEKISVKE